MSWEVRLSKRALRSFEKLLVSFSLEEVFPNLHSGSAIKGLRYREGLTQAALAKRIGIPRRHICEMENGKRKIEKEMAKRLAKELNTKKVFMCL